MTKLEQYIQQEYNGRSDWFISETKRVHHQLRINKILDYKEYLSGLHKISRSSNVYYNGQLYETPKIMLQYAKTILDFQANYLLSKPITLVGSQDVVDAIAKVYKRGNYNQIDYNLLDSVIKYGVGIEYVTYQDGIITSKVLDPADCYAIFDNYMGLIGLIEHWVIEGNVYYRVYNQDAVASYQAIEGELRLVDTAPSVGGLPIVYKSRNELDPCDGRSELEDIIPIIDELESLISKYSASFFRHHNPIPVVIGQQLRGDGGLDPQLVGGGIVLDDGSDFKMVANNLDYKSFESVYNTLKQALLDISSTPAVSLNSQDVSNLSEVSIKLLFSLADVKAGLNEKYMRQGIEQRFERIRDILALQGTAIDEDSFDTLDVVFSYARPRNEQDIISDIKTLREIQAISLESALSHSPYTSDVYQELERINAEGTGVEE